MFGISFVELIIVALVFIFAVKPGDAPNIARSIGRYYSRAKSMLKTMKDSVDNVKNDIGFEDIKKDFDIGAHQQDVESKVKKGSVSQIVDIYGKTHYVADIESIRPDLSKEEIEKELKASNTANSSDAEKESEK